MSHLIRRACLFLDPALSCLACRPCHFIREHFAAPFLAVPFDMPIFNGHFASKLHHSQKSVLPSTLLFITLEVVTSTLMPAPPRFALKRDPICIVSAIDCMLHTSHAQQYPHALSPSHTMKQTQTPTQEDEPHNFESSNNPNTDASTKMQR